MTELAWYIFPLLFLIALMYSSVGHGGGSGYLALMALAGISVAWSKPIVLCMNCVVSLIAFVQYFRSGYFNTRLFLWVAITSIPAAYLGALMPLSDHSYRILLGSVLLLVSLRFLIPLPSPSGEKKAPVYLLLLIGAGIGFLSGMIGIGGGVLLTPLVLLMGWAPMKQTASVSALFIFVNSVSGLLALFKKGISFDYQSCILLLVACGGGLLGSWLGARKWNVEILRKVLSIGLMIASLKLIFL